MNTLALLSPAPPSAVPARTAAPDAPGAAPPADAGFAALLGLALAPAPADGPAAPPLATDPALAIDAPQAPVDDKLPHKPGKPGALRRALQDATQPRPEKTFGAEQPLANALPLVPDAPTPGVDSVPRAQPLEDAPAAEPSPAPGLEVACARVDPAMAAALAPKRAADPAAGQLPSTASERAVAAVIAAPARGADPAAGQLPPTASERAVAAAIAAPRGRDPAPSLAAARAATDENAMGEPVPDREAGSEASRAAPRASAAPVQVGNPTAPNSPPAPAVTKGSDSAPRDRSSKPAPSIEPTASTPSATPAATDKVPSVLPGMAGLAPQQVMPRYEATSAAVAQAHIHAAPDSPAFAPALASQVRWFVDNGLPQAQLNLNPADLGPVAVRIVLDGTQARIDFTAEMAATRGAIESSLPVLAASLAEGGLTLAGGGVFDGSPSHSQQQSQAPSAERQAAERQAANAARRRDEDGSASHATPPAARGLVDLVA